MKPMRNCAPFRQRNPASRRSIRCCRWDCAWSMRHVIELDELIAASPAGPSGILGLPFGTLSVGASADVCIFDPNLTWQLNTDTIRSNGHNTPFMGWEMKGRVTYTLLAGKLVFTALRYEPARCRPKIHPHPELLPRRTAIRSSSKTPSSFPMSAIQATSMSCGYRRHACALRARPGSFAHMQCAPTLPLRRPLSIMRADAGQGWIEFLYKDVGSGTHALSCRNAGETDQSDRTRRHTVQAGPVTPARPDAGRRRRHPADDLSGRQPARRQRTGGRSF